MKKNNIHFMNLVYLIESDLRTLVENIIPQNELKYLPPMIQDVTSLSPLMDYVYAIEKYLGNRIIPYKYTIKYSSLFDSNNKSTSVKKRLNQLEKMLINGDMKINLSSYNYLPRSAKSYFKAEYDSENQYRFVPDCNYDFFGIRHFHLTNSTDDELLFFSILKDVIYFFKIGSHSDLYRKDIVECIVKNFPELINHNQILKIDGISLGKEKEFSPEEVKALWSSGNNIMFKIDGIGYTGMPQTFARINSRIIHIVSNITYQAETFIDSFINEICANFKIDGNELNFVIKKYNDSPLNSDLLIVETKTNSKGRLYIPYLENVVLINFMINKNNDA